MLKKGERCPKEWGFVRHKIEAKQKPHNEKDDMSTQTTTSEYLLLFRGTHWHKNLSPEELQNVMSQWSTWYDRLVARGKIKSAQPLADEGKIVTWKKGQTVADGPFAESKEAIGGYFLLENVDMEESLEIAKECPMLKFGVTVEIRPVALQCASLQKINRPFAEATA
jgi:hypothetical protein